METGKKYITSLASVKVFLVSLVLLQASLKLTLVQAQACTPPTASISLVSSSICHGNPAFLQLTAATGQGPFNLTVNGVNYSNINVGENFGPLNTADISIWNNANTPFNADSYDGQSIEIGMKFQSAINGYITGIRFYKGVTNTGVHIASLWTGTGTLLANANFIAETASGWQEVRFTTPVAIQAGITYIASYYAQSGVYALTTDFFTAQGATNGNLTALQSGVDGLNGVFKYGGGFPTASYANNNYWVDVLFTPSITTSAIDYVLTSITDANGCNNSGNLSTATLSINPLPTGVLSASQTVCSGQEIHLNFNASSGTGPFSVTTNSVINNNINNNQPFASHINANLALPAPLSIWPTGAVTGIEPVVSDNSPVELGVKFKSTITGSITAIRFYKRVENTGTHTGSLWTSSGTLLATATFTSETASGWQQVDFPFPIAITANQVFVASYFSPNGQYAHTPYYFTGYSATNGPLSAVQSNGSGDPNGLYQYGGGFPTASYNDNNYWVDVVFAGTQGDNVINMTEITDANGCTTTASPIQSIAIPSTECVPLSVTLVDFHLTALAKKALLEWKTSSENNNKGFEIQRSSNEHNWQTIGFVNGAGNSTIEKYYSFTDQDIAGGRYYYQLKQVDLDGKFKFSKVLTADFADMQFHLGQNFPNPASGQTIINYSVPRQSMVNISLYDVYGRVLRIFANETKSAGQYTINADLHALSPGTYYYRMSAGAFNETKKLVVGSR